MNREIFFNGVRRAFGSIESAETVRAYERYLDEFEAQGVTDLRWQANILGQIHHETGARIYPVRETFAESDEQARSRLRTSSYAKPAGPYGHAYYGRGGLQTTWLENYEKLSPIAGVDLVFDPDQLLDSKISARCDVNGMVHGRYRRDAGGRQTLARYFPKEGRWEWFGAREIVNGDKHKRPQWLHGKSIGEAIAEYSQAYFEALTAGRVAAPGPPPISTPDPVPSVGEKQYGPLTVVVFLVTFLFGAAAVIWEKFSSFIGSLFSS